jgi:toxin ParE1/3/4
MRLALAPRAKSDLKDIWNYIFEESQSEAIASRWIERLLRTIGRLKESPRIGRSRAEDLGADLRTFPSGGYVILYRIDASAVRVIRVLHGSRNINKLLL